MVPDICFKLQRFIDKGIRSESDVIYLLVCIRKLLDQCDDVSRYFELKFYCDWALHTKMSGRGAHKVLDDFNDLHDEFVKGNRSIHPNIENIAKFTDFKKQMVGFLNTQSVALSLSVSEWSRVLYLYLSIVEDCPLKINANFIDSASIDNVVVEVIEADRIECNQQYYMVVWNVTDKEGNNWSFPVYNSFDVLDQQESGG